MQIVSLSVTLPLHDSGLGGVGGGGTSVLVVGAAVELEVLVVAGVLVVTGVLEVVVGVVVSGELVVGALVEGDVTFWVVL